MEEERKQQLAARLRAAAKAAGLKSHTLAARSGFKAARVRGWWSGRNRIPAEAVPLLAAALGLPAEALLEGPPVALGYVQEEEEATPLWPRLTPAQRTAVVELIDVLGRENDRLQHG